MFFRRYKEILFSLMLGALAWVLDAAMHAQLGSLIGSEGFIAEMLRPGQTHLLFRSIYVLLALIIGWRLWSSNRKEREMRELLDAMEVFLNRLSVPVSNISKSVGKLQHKTSVARNEIAMDLAKSLGEDACSIENMSKQCLCFCEQMKIRHVNDEAEQHQVGPNEYKLKI